MIIFP
jgi:hypothetical protein